MLWKLRPYIQLTPELVKMECNKEEAFRAKEIAERKFAENDIAGAKRYAVKAQKLYPGLDGLAQFVSVLDVFVSAEKSTYGEADWYRVLGVDPSADYDTIRKRHRKLALILHPDKNKSVGAEEAFKIISQALSILSNKDKRIAYDQARNLMGHQVVPNSRPTEPTRQSSSHNPSNNQNLTGRDQKNVLHAKPASPPHLFACNTFWTQSRTCPRTFENPIQHINRNLFCKECKDPFQAVEIPEPPGARLHRRQSSQRVQSTATRTEKLKRLRKEASSSGVREQFQRGRTHPLMEATTGLAAGCNAGSRSMLKGGGPKNNGHTCEHRTNNYGREAADTMKASAEYGSAQSKPRVAVPTEGLKRQREEASLAAAKQQFQEGMAQPFKKKSNVLPEGGFNSGPSFSSVLKGESPSKKQRTLGPDTISHRPGAAAVMETFFVPGSVVRPIPVYPEELRRQHVAASSPGVNVQFVQGMAHPFSNTGASLYAGFPNAGSSSALRGERRCTPDPRIRTSNFERDAVQQTAAFSKFGSVVPPVAAHPEKLQRQFEGVSAFGVKQQVVQGTAHLFTKTSASSAAGFSYAGSSSALKGERPKERRRAREHRTGNFGREVVNLTEAFSKGGTVAPPVAVYPEKLKKQGEEAPTPGVKDQFVQGMTYFFSNGSSNPAPGFLGAGSRSVLKQSGPKERGRIHEQRTGNVGREAAHELGKGNVRLGGDSGSQKQSLGKGRGNVSGSRSSRQFSDLQNLLMNKARKHIVEEIKELSNRATRPKTSEAELRKNEKGYKKAAGNGAKPEAKERPGVKHAEAKICLDKCKISPPSGDLHAQDLGTTSMAVVDSDFHNFDKDRTAKSFANKEVWAAYDDYDGMPRFYAVVHTVLSRRPFKMEISWLNSKSNREFSTLDWIDSGFYKTSGEFWIGKRVSNNFLNSFSHKVKNWKKGTRGCIKIYPGKGDVWALYRNWSPSWNALTDDSVIHEYDMVEVLEDYNEERGVAIAPLVKVAGFRTVFRRHSDPGKIRVVPREEMFRFSHQVPSHFLTGGQEGRNNVPKDCLELDPASLPAELLQVWTEEVQQEEKVETTKEAAGGELLEDGKGSIEEKLVADGKPAEEKGVLEDAAGRDSAETMKKKAEETKESKLKVYVRRKKGNMKG